MCNRAIRQNRTANCRNLNGGVAEFYPFNFVENAFTVVDGIATAKSDDLTVAYKYIITGDLNALNQVKVVDAKNGNSVVSQTVIGQLKQITGEDNHELENLAEGTISGVLKDRNGKYHWVGHEDGFNMKSTIESVTGGTKQDFSGYNITLEAENKMLAPVLDEATATAFLSIIAS